MTANRCVRDVRRAFRLYKADFTIDIGDAILVRMKTAGERLKSEPLQTPWRWIESVKLQPKAPDQS